MSSIRRILVATDFSPASGAALNFALGLARPVGAEIHVIHVIDNLALNLVELPRYAYLQSLKAECEQAARERIGKLVSSEPPIRMPVRIEVLTAAAPAAAIVKHAERVDADLIVMGTHGLGDLGRLVLGSVADRVIRTASCPVLTICDGEIEAGERRTVTRILVPTDFRPSALAALGYAQHLARATGASLYVLHIVDDVAGRYLEYPFNALGELQTSVEESARHQLDEIVTQEKELGLSRPHAAIVKSTAPARAIVGYAKDNRIDLIVMGTHGRAPVVRLFLGSVADRVVRSASCPVITVREPKRASAETLDVQRSNSEVLT